MATAPNPPGYPWQRGQKLNASALDAQFALCITTDGNPLTTNNIVVGSGINGGVSTLESSGISGQVLTSSGSDLPPEWTTVDTYDSANVEITGGSIDGTEIGTTVESSGKFTTLDASGSITGDQIVSTVSTGTAPFVVASTTVVPNLNSATATNISGGTNGSLPYQTSAGVTSMLSIGDDGDVLTLDSGIPTWIAGSGSSYDPAAVAITGGTIDGVTLSTIGSTITPDTVKGIVGTTLGDSAQAGSVGEVLRLTNTISTISSNSTGDCVTLTLPAGCWLVSGSAKFVTASGATLTTGAIGLNLTPTTLPSAPLTCGGDGLNVAFPGSFTPVAASQVFDTTGGSMEAHLAYFGVFSGGDVDITGQITAIRIR